VTSSSVTVRHNKGYLKLCLPNFFEKALLADVRGVMGLLRKHPSLNEKAHETLERFFPAWESDLKEHAAIALAMEAAKAGAAQNHAGTASKNDKRKKALKFAADAAKRAKAAVKRCRKVIDAYKTTKA
jgi:hypothetical protein